MAHPCFSCGSECYCHGDIDDIICSKTPRSCDGCGCDNFSEDDELDYGDWPEDDEDCFIQCAGCDGHDACADFGCAIKAGIPISHDPSII